MTILQPKHPRLRLDPESYRLLHRAILERDRWRGQLCGTNVGLEVHHVIPRSRLGDDLEENLITLCSKCHRKTHRRR